MPSTKRRVLFALEVALCVLPAAALFAFTRAHHEFWRDEAQALLIGRDVPLRGLLQAVRYEGAPPLFHLLLKVLCVVFRGPTALALGGAIGYGAAIAGTLHLLCVVSRRPIASLAITFALAATDTYIYELGVVCRQYGLGIGLALAGIAELVVARQLKSRRHALSGTLLCSLAAISSVHAACVAGAALASFAILELLRKPSASRVARALPTIAALPFFAITVYCIAPFPDRTPEASVAANPGLRAGLVQAKNFLENGALTGGWWRGNVTTPSWSFALFAAGIALVAALRLRGRRRDLFPFGIVLLSWATLLFIFVTRYAGAYRHHLFLWIPALVFALGWIADHRFARGRMRWIVAAAALLLVPRIGAQYPLAWLDLSADRRGAFSQTKSAAELLPPDAHVVSDYDLAILGLRLWREDVTLRACDGRGRRFRHIVSDRDWHRRAPLAPMIADECKTAPDRLFFAQVKMSPDRLRRCLAPLQKRNALLPTERFDLYRVDCACVAGL